MALMDAEPHCSWKHRGCPGHAIEPMLRGLPNADPPNAGRCQCGALEYLWQVPLDGKFYCRRCIRRILRIATYPTTLRFPSD